MTSPTSRTLAKLRLDGWTAQVVERWCPHSKRRIDLFQVIDVLAVGSKGILGVQACVMSGRAAREKKIKASAGAKAWIYAGGLLQVWAWRKILKKRGGKVGKWEVAITSIGMWDLNA